MDGFQTTSTSRKWYGKKKTKTTTKTSLNSNAVTTNIAAKNIILNAESDINIFGSELQASPTGNIEVSAGRLLNLYAVEDRDENAVDIKEKSSFLGVRYNKNHTNDTRQELTQLPAKLIGDKAYTNSGGDTLLQGSVFKTLKASDIQVGVGKYADDSAKVILAPITNQINKTHTQDRESTVWMKTVDQGSVVTTAQLPKFNQAPTITSPTGVVVAVPVEVTVDSNAKAKAAIQKSQEELGKIALSLSKQPGYEYLATLDKSNDINWVQVDLIQNNWDYTQEGLTPGAAALIAIAVAVAAGPAGSGLSASMVATNAAGIALQTQAVITLINNKGDISKTLKDMASSDTISNMATAALTAGLTANLNIPNMTNSNFANELIQGVVKSTSNAAIESAIGGTSFQDALKNNLINAFVDIGATQVAGQIGDLNFSDSKFVDGLSRSIVHGMTGCIAGQVTSKDCGSRAMGAALGEAIGSYMADSKRQFKVNDKNEIISFVPDIDKPFILNTTKLVTASVAALYGLDVNDAAQGSDIAVINNGMSDINVAERRGELNKLVFGDLEARLVAATISIVVWPVGVLEAYQRADNDTDKLLILREAFAGAKARALNNALEQAIISSVRYNNPQVYRENLARQAGLPSYINLSQPKDVYGLDSQKLKTYYEIKGYHVNSVKDASQGSGNAQVYAINNHPEIAKIQHSPSTEHLQFKDRSQHGGEYIKFTLKGPEKDAAGIMKPAVKDAYGNKKIYVIDPKAFVGTAKNSTFYNQQGQRLQYVNDKYKVIK